jgi:hypothetical protein
MFFVLSYNASSPGENLSLPLVITLALGAFIASDSYRFGNMGTIIASDSLHFEPTKTSTNNAVLFLQSIILPTSAAKLTSSDY